MVVGVNDYAEFGAEAGGDLMGSVNDARAFRDVLQEQWGLDPKNVVLLEDAMATKAAIREALTEWVPQRAIPGDLVVFYFAGHGAQSWDTDGDEEDGLDETLAPHDARAASTENDITDDELGRWLRALPTSNIVVVLDNCHAGTGTRAAVPRARARTLARDVRRLPRLAGSRSGVAPRSAASAPPEAEVVELAAAQADQVAVDFAWQVGDSIRWGGAFTTVLIDQMRRAPAGITYADLFRDTSGEMRRLGFAQEPRLTMKGSPTALAFGADPSGTPPALTVLGYLDGGKLRIGGSAIHKITEGSIVDVAGDLYRVRRVDPRSADIEPAASISARVEPFEKKGIEGLPVLLAGYRFADPALRVAWTGGPETLRDMLAEKTGSDTTGARSGYELVADSNADISLIVNEGRVQIVGVDGVVIHTVVGTNEVTAAAVRAWLRRKAASRFLERLENPRYPFPLDLRLTGNRMVLQVGEELRFRVRSGRAGYLTLVDVAPDGSVSRLFPNEFDPQSTIRAGEELILPTGRMRAQDGRFLAAEPAGSGMLRAFLTQSPLSLEEPADDPDAILRALFRAAGPPLVHGSEAVPTSNWATTAVVYRIVAVVGR